MNDGTPSKCLLCDNALGAPPEHEVRDSPRVTYRDYGYIHGFADGVKAAREGIGPLLCDAHTEYIRQALVSRGLVLGKDPRR
jgi:hypothetical protein